jgi:hypothetical protein
MLVPTCKIPRRPALNRPEATMKTKSSRWFGWCWLAAAMGLAGCAGSSEVVTKAPATPTGYGYGFHSSSPAPTAAQAPSAPMHGGQSEAPPSADYETAAPPGERPGLGTEWGETRYSHVNTVSFDRADPGRPFQVLSLYYNDHDGARAMARYGDYRDMGNAFARDPGSGISISLNDDAGRPLPAFFAGGRTYAIGEAGQRYTIVVSNQTGMRIEAVASVDGLDVLDGQPADYGKRGYLVPAWGSVEIDGFRQSNDNVAAFRFGSVRDSYAARTGSDRNVGVIGVALFAPRNAPSWPWTEREIQRRKTADPFPGGYASPPPPRW